jgi:hypothetical protein
MLFLKLLDKHQSFILGLKKFETFFAKRALNDIPRSLIVIHGNWSVTDWTIYFYRHVSPPFLLVSTGKSAGCPAGRAATDSSTGVKTDLVIISTLPGSPAVPVPS